MDSVSITIVVLLVLSAFFVYSEWRADKKRQEGVDKAEQA
jgi:preprotein translocase subunit YajC